MSRAAGWSRRQFLVFGIFGWLPFFRPRHISLDGAHFRILRRGHSPRRYLVIHGNEEAAREVLTRFMRTHDGVAYIIESHTRNVAIAGGQIDPNRMFSRAGARASLLDLNPSWTPEQVEAALRILDRGREHLVHAFFPPDHGLLVALHNNSEEYSVLDEQPISDAVSLREPTNPHAFFLCTDPGDFAILAGSPYNVVLQKDKPQQDDGSLSRLAARRGVRYLNLEVRQGDAARQMEMLEWLDSHVP
ncbi:MAG TPA: hypothetical protein VJ732_04325 [Bryobacteraceae bacterium]|nr:hypothetical protein [Bryobacteraceae bacterium]